MCDNDNDDDDDDENDDDENDNDNAAQADGGNLLCVVDDIEHNISVWDWARGEKGHKVSFYWLQQELKE